MLSDAVRKAADELGSRLRGAFGARLQRLVLFGSHARGEATERSDVDVLVVIEGMSGRERAQVYETGAEVYMDTMVPIAPTALSTAEYDHLVQRERAFPREIERDGIPL